MSAQSEARTKSRLELLREIKPGIGNRFILSTGVIVLMALLLFLTWNELVSEFHASVNDFASSFNIHDQTDTQ